MRCHLYFVSPGALLGALLAAAIGQLAIAQGVPAAVLDAGPDAGDGRTANPDHAQASDAQQVVDDAMITETVKTALMGDPRTNGRPITVNTHNGYVQLNGHVDSAATKLAATEVAQSVEGVRGVDNQLNVRS